MRSKKAIGLTVILAAELVTFLGARSLGSSRPQLEQTARCIMVVPNQGVSTSAQDRTVWNSVHRKWRFPTNSTH